MLEADLLEKILKAGSFGLVALLIIWLLFRGAPMLRDSIKESNAAQIASSKSVAEGFKESVQIICDSNKEVLAKIGKECRDERRELFDRLFQERELDRKSRHDDNNRLQVAIGEIEQLSRMQIEKFTEASREQMAELTTLIRELVSAMGEKSGGAESCQQGT